MFKSTRQVAILEQFFTSFRMVVVTFESETEVGYTDHRPCCTSGDKKRLFSMATRDACSRRSELRFGCPEMFLIPTHRERLIPHGSARVFRRYTSICFAKQNTGLNSPSTSVSKGDFRVPPRRSAPGSIFGQKIDRFWARLKTYTCTL